MILQIILVGVALVVLYHYGMIDKFFSFIDNTNSIINKNKENNKEIKKFRKYLKRSAKLNDEIV